MSNKNKSIRQDSKRQDYGIVDDTKNPEYIPFPIDISPFIFDDVKKNKREALLDLIKEKKYRWDKTVGRENLTKGILVINHSDFSLLPMDFNNPEYRIYGLKIIVTNDITEPSVYYHVQRTS